MWPLTLYSFDSLADSLTILQSLLCPHFSFLISSLSSSDVFLNLQCKHSLPSRSSSLLIYSPSAHMDTCTTQQVPGVGWTSGATGGNDARWHTHFTAEGMPMVEGGMCPSLWKLACSKIKGNTI